jgi:hypothetical protein
LRKVIKPPLAPPLKGSTIDVQDQALAQSAETLRSEAMPHGGDEQNNKTDVNATSQKSHGGGSVTLAAALLFAAEAMAANGLARVELNTPRLALEIGLMKPSSTMNAARLAADFREISIAFFQEWPQG